MDITTQAQESESFCPIYLDIDTTFEGNLSTVKKNLEDNRLSKKTKAMEEILLMHLKGEDVSCLLMDIIRFAVPSTDHRIKRLVYLFFQTFDMCKKDGTPRDEVILVCNALRNDLCSPNEYVRGSVLRLLSRLTIFNIIQPLIPSIINNVEHQEPYVYRNALLCLTNISEQFGSDLITSSFGSVENFITNSDDVFGTVRAYKLLESCNLDLCIQFIIAVEGNLLNLSPLIHLAILFSFEKLSSINQDVAQMMMRMLTVLLQFSNNNSVLFYSANLLLKYHQNYANNIDDIRVCCKCLIKVLLNESDLNVKMTVLDKLKSIHNKTTSMHMPHVLEDFVNDLLKGLSVTNLVVTSKLLSLVLKVATKSNVEVIVSSLLRNFVKVDMNYSNEEVTNYRSILLEGLFNLTKSFSRELLKVVNELVEYLTINNDVTSTQVSLLMYEVVKQLKTGGYSTVYVDGSNTGYGGTSNTNTSNTGNSTNGTSSKFGKSSDEEVEKLLNKVVSNFDAMVCKEVLSNCLYMVGEYSNNYDIIYELYKLFDSGFSKKNEVNGNVDRKSFHNVVLADGSYSTTYTGFDSNRKDENESKGFYSLLTKNSDILLYNTLSTTVLKLLYKYLTGPGSNSSQYGLQDRDDLNQDYSSTNTNSSSSTNSDKAKNYVEYSSIVIVKLIELLDKDVYYIKRLKMMLVLLLGLLKDRPKYLKLMRTYLKLSTKTDASASSKEEEEEYRQFSLEFNLNDFFGSGSTSKSEFSSRNKEEEEEDDEAVLLNELSTYSKIHQFTSLTDPLYVEGYIKLIGNKLYFNLFIENKSNEVLQNITLDLSTGTNLQLVTNRKMMTLPPKATTRTQVKFRVVSSNDETVYGYVYYSTSNTILLQCLSFNPIHVSMYEFITPTKISSNLFRTYWNDFEWEHKIKLSNIKVKPNQLLKSIIKVTNMSVIKPNYGQNKYFHNSHLNYELGCFNEDLLYKSQDDSRSDRDDEDYNFLDNSFFSINLFLKTIFDEEAIANLSLVKRVNNTYSGCFRIRSRSQNVALGLGDRVAMVTREIAV